MMNMALRSFVTNRKTFTGINKFHVLAKSTGLSLKSTLVKNPRNSIRLHSKVSNRNFSSNLNPFGAGNGLKRNSLLVTLSFTSPLTFWKKQDVDPIEQVFQNIPKEVFKKDVLTRPKRSSFGRIFFRLLYNIKLGLRFVQLSCIYFPILVLYPFACVSRTTKRYWWRLLLFACELTGPTFIKLGQWASTRRDLFDEEFCLIFSKLHNQTQHHSWYYTKQKLKKAFGKNWKKIFARVDRKPVGSGCIAQVRFRNLISQL